MVQCEVCNQEMYLSRYNNHLIPFEDDDGQPRINTYLVFVCPSCERRIFRRLSFVRDPTWDMTTLDEEEYEEECERMKNTHMRGKKR